MNFYFVFRTIYIYVDIYVFISFLYIFIHPPTHPSIWVDKNACPLSCDLNFTVLEGKDKAVCHPTPSPPSLFLTA